MARTKMKINGGQRSGNGPLPTKASGKMKMQGKFGSSVVRSSVRSDARKSSNVRSSRAPSREKSKSRSNRHRSVSRTTKKKVEYEVVQVCGVKKDQNGKVVEYNLLWKENAKLKVVEGTKTWEPTSCAAGCQDLVNAFEERQKTGRYIVNDDDYVDPTSSTSLATIPRPRSYSPADCIHESVCRRYLLSIGKTKDDYSPGMIVCERFLTPQIVLGRHVHNVIVTPGRENDIIVYPEAIREKFVDYMDKFNEILHRHHPLLNERRHFCIWRRALICSAKDCVCDAHYGSLYISDCQYLCESMMIRRPDTNPNTKPATPTQN